MYKTVFFLVRRPELSAEEFRKRWTTEHLRRVAGLPGLRRIRGNTVMSSPAPHGIDAIGEFWWESQEAFEKAVASEEGQRVVADIEAITLSHEHVVVQEHQLRPRQATTISAR
jgi:uncharacterized protein (TIGR02118 family)